MMIQMRGFNKCDIDCPESMLPADDNGVRVSSFRDEGYAQELRCRAVAPARWLRGGGEERERTNY